MISDATDYRAPTLPAKREDIVLHELDGEAVLYDERSGAVHRFNETTLAVWNACDGSRSASDVAWIIAKKYALDLEKARIEVDRVVRSLATKGLLLDACTNDHLHHDGESEQGPLDQDLRLEPADADVESQSVSKLPSRREVLRGGTAKLIYTAPLISTFFATGANASGLPASQAYGTDSNGGCKTIGFSCAVNNDCCQDPAKTKCRSADNNCCCQHNETCCTTDADCCNGGDSCVAGDCV